MIIQVVVLVEVMGVILAMMMKVVVVGMVVIGMVVVTVAVMVGVRRVVW